MKTKFALSLAVAAACVAALAEPLTCASPDGKNALTFALGEKGEPTYSFAYRGKKVVEPSTLGFDIKALGKDAFEGRRPGELRTGFVLAGVERASADETWRPVWGEESEIRDRHEEMLVKLVQKGTGRRMDLRFRVFDDGMGFRYEFPADDDNSVARLVPGENIAPEGKTQPLTHFTIVEERTRFNIPCDATAWWIPADYETQEYRYTKSRVSEIPGLFKAAPDANLSSTLTDFPAVQTALMLRYDDGLLVNIHEAACVDYATMHLRVEGTSFESSLTPDATGAKGWMQTPCKSPWRTLIVGDKGADILSSRITLNLNEPCAIEDTSWIHPVKYIGVWWTMITGAKNWAYMPDPSMHAANTTNVMRHIDFALRLRDAVSRLRPRGAQQVRAREGREADDVPRDQRLDAQLRAPSRRGVRAHEPPRLRLGEGRLRRQHPPARRDALLAVEQQPLPLLHQGGREEEDHGEPARGGASDRTLPHVAEPHRQRGPARGTEYESFGGNNADHTTILPFTRLVGGPMDYTPGIFETDLSKICSWKKQRISSTLAGQLALYVTMFSPLQMAADVPESYEKRLDALQFIKDVPCDWDESRYLEAEIGDYLTIVRRAKGKDEWYLGKAYEATIYADAPDAVYRTETAGNYVIEKRTVSSADTLRLRAAPGGGAAVSFKPNRVAASSR